MNSPAKRRFDLIAFDWDGTLFDSTAIIVRSIQCAVRDVGGSVPSDKDAAYVIGLGLGQALAHAAPDVPKEKYPLLGERYKHHYGREQDQITLFPGVLEMLAELKARQYFLTVATGKSRWGLDQALAHVDLKDLFHASRTADETAGKPHPRMLHELMAEMGVPPERTLMVGDTTHDLQLAANAGCASVGVNYGAHDASALAAHKPLYIADSAQALHYWMRDNA
jgi:phosphoglycolate phosphatase